MTLLLAALFGLLIGSFLNVCIYRLPRDLGVVTPRSFCPECGVQVAALDNIPIFSFLLLKGRCRACKQTIGWRYPIVELLSAVTFALVVNRYGLSPAALKWITFASLTIVLFFTDLEERLLPDECTVGGLVIGIVLAFIVPVPSTLGRIMLSELHDPWRSQVILVGSALLLSLPVWSIAAAYSKIRGREALGLGDVKLLACLGSYLGFENAITAMLVASLAGSALGLVLLIRHRSAAFHYELPFGSFLCGAAFLLPLVTTIA